jgi:hypothetical protein
VLLKLTPLDIVLLLFGRRKVADVDDGFKFNEVVPISQAKSNPSMEARQGFM